MRHMEPRDNLTNCLEQGLKKQGSEAEKERSGEGAAQETEANVKSFPY